MSGLRGTGLAPFLFFLLLLTCAATRPARTEDPAPAQASGEQSASDQQSAPAAIPNPGSTAPPVAKSEPEQPPAANQEATAPAAQSPAPAAAPVAAARNPDCPRSTFRVVVDVGHTVDKPGADSARGVTEYSFNLRLVGEIMEALARAGFDKAVRLITSAAPYRGLLERAERANLMHADLFISIHHDSVPDYLLEKWDYEGKQNPYSDRFKGYAIFVSNENGDRKASLAFAHSLGEELRLRGLHYTPHYTLPLMRRYRHELLDADAGVYRYDQLVVLRKTSMPAVLLEAGSIINRDEELEMASPERRAATSAAVEAAVETFCAAHARIARAAARLRTAARPSGSASAALHR